MNLYSQHPYWLMKNGIINTYNSLDKDMSVDVAVMGAGISGALAAFYLRNAGLSIAVFDEKHAGCGSTAASTSFLQYEIDKPLRELSKMVGESHAIQAYRLCRDAIYEIENICHKLKPDFEFNLRPSLQYASYKKDVAPLAEEYELRGKHGFDIRWVDEVELKDKFGIYAPGAVLSKDGGEVDAYALTHAMLEALYKKGHGVYNNTPIKEIKHGGKGVKLITDKGFTITAKKLIVATGYESLKYIPKKVADIHTTYAIVSEPLSKDVFWYKDSIVWETSNPYLYFRKVSSSKILVGGKDDEFHRPVNRESVIKRKAEMLTDSFCKRVQHIPLKADYSWCGAFAVTKDGLPYIGGIPHHPNTYFALGYGGNGITFSVIAAQIIKDMIAGKKNKNAAIFDFNR